MGFRISHKTSPSPFEQRLLLEVVRLDEEAAGHPAHTPAADAAAIAAGGDFSARLRTRARHLPQADAILAAIRRLRRGGLLLAAAVLALAGIAGSAAATAVLGEGRPVSLPLALLVIVGFNLASLLVWLLLQPWSARVTPGLGRWLHGVWRCLGRAPMETKTAQAQPVLRLLGGGPAGRWLVSALVHAAWLAFTLAALATLAVLLSVRAYELVWETTLLSPQALARSARLLSSGPALLGLAGPQSLPLSGEAALAAHESWARWLLAAVFVYGLLPRAAALLGCLALARRAMARYGRDWSRPGYARLRARLLPDHVDLGVASPAAPPAPAPPRDPVRPGHADGPLLAAGFEWAPGDETVVGEDCHWLGTADDAVSRKALLAALPRGTGALLALVVRAGATPDRGAERFAAAVAAVLPAVLVLAETAALQQRGEAAASQRLQDWRALAARAGTGGPLPWPPGTPLAAILAESAR